MLAGISTVYGVPRFHVSAVEENLAVAEKRGNQLLDVCEREAAEQTAHAERVAEGKAAFGGTFQDELAMEQGDLHGMWRW